MLRPSSCCVARTWKLVHYSYVDSWLTGGLTVMGIFVVFAAFSGSSSELSPPGHCTGTGPCII